MTGLARLEAAFSAAKAAGRCALVPYLCAGDPDAETTRAVLAAIGPFSDAIELGVPYGDPLADGPVIAAAAQRALEAKMNLDGVFALVREAVRNEAPPIVLFSYLNPVVQYGIERFAGELVASGACGAIVPDVPLEEIGELRAAFAARALALPLLVAPTTPLARAERIAEGSDAFVYLVSRLGVTGTRREPDFAWIAERVTALRRASGKAVAVGFGIATPEHVRRIAALADGAIVGSALVEAYAGTRGDEAAERAHAFVRLLATAAQGGPGP